MPSIVDSIELPSFLEMNNRIVQLEAEALRFKEMERNHKQVMEEILARQENVSDICKTIF